MPKITTPLTIFVPREKIVAKDPSLQQPLRVRVGTYWWFLLAHLQPHGGLTYSTPTFSLLANCSAPNLQDLADLLETCCEDVGQGCGSTDPLSGECRLKRLLELWEDGRARVRACAVRSLLALTTGMIG